VTEYSRVRGYFRLLKLLGMMILCWLDGIAEHPQTLEERCAWRQKWSRRSVAVLGMSLQVEGPVPQTGLVVANHVSYIDVLVLGAVLPCVFVSKDEVKHWPIVGLLTNRAGTIYLQRGSVRAAAEVNRAIASALMTDVPVGIFPEGTTTDGSNLLPFHAALFEPAMRSQSPVWPAAISYDFHTGESATRKVAYFGDDVFLPHLVRLARLHPITATVRFAAEPLHAERRGDAANASWQSVARLLLRRDDAPSARPDRTAQQTTLA
jgi:lyso-ornithine lipid O-acyltransferase